MTVEFSYRPDNLRLKRTKGTIVNYLIWDGGQIVAELNGTGALTDCYAYGLERIKSKGIRYFIQNGQGDVVHYADKNGKIMTSYSYDEYGNVTGGNATNPFRYRGEYYDTDLRLYYLRARWYDSALGEFISEDPVKDGVNWYVYCANNPVKFRDPSGLKPGDEFDNIDEAAEDAGNYLLSLTHKNDKEEVAYIYIDDGKYKYFRTLNESKEPMYAFDVSWGRGRTPNALVHTHVYYDVEHPNNILSRPGNTSNSNGGNDIEFADSNGVIIYGAMPTGELLKHSPGGKDESGIVISKDLIVDPKYTTYHQIKGTIIWDLIDNNRPDIDKMDVVKSHIKNPNNFYRMLKELGVV